MPTSSLLDLVRANPAAAPSELVDRWEAGDFELAISSHIIIEVMRTFEDPYFQRRMTSAQLARVRILLQHQAKQTTVSAEIQGIATHPEDDLVLATAISARADYLVTGDLQLQKLGEYQSVVILSPRAFLDRLLR
jgi:putative PIN family toxin of toxin-antitoxin system